NGGITVEGCFLGTDTSGTIALPNLYGFGFGCTSSSRLGGPDPSQRNLISGNLAVAITVSGDHSTASVTIQNNLVGTDRTGTNAIPNGSYAILTPTGGVGGSGFAGINCLVADNVFA